uniref:Uncharacterized protein n=1 Tax=Leersia perrieri TaxID=77586 RepID=A0A0D9WQQ6_9ORYZ
MRYEEDTKTGVVYLWAKTLRPMTIATEDATESARDPITPSWKPGDIIATVYLLLWSHSTHMNRVSASMSKLSMSQ